MIGVYTLEFITLICILITLVFKLSKLLSGLTQKTVSRRPFKPASMSFWHVSTIPWVFSASRYFWLVLYFLCPSVEISQFFKEPWSVFSGRCCLETKIWYYRWSLLVRRHCSRAPLEGELNNLPLTLNTLKLVSSRCYLLSEWSSPTGYIICFFNISSPFFLTRKACFLLSLPYWLL